MQDLSELVQAVTVFRKREITEPSHGVVDEVVGRVTLLCATVRPAVERAVEEPWVVVLTERSPAEAVGDVNRLNGAGCRRVRERPHNSRLEVLVQLHALYCV